MKTIHRYEAVDIDLSDPVHSFLAGVILVATLKVMVSPGREEPETLMKGVIADILNLASDDGVVITKAEVPSAFTR